MGKEEILDKWRKKREKIFQMGGEQALKKRKEKGLMNARERIDYLFDKGTFVELGTFVTHRSTKFGMDKKFIPGDGIITGFGKINGREVVVASEDYTCMGGSFGEYHGKKFANAVRIALEKRCPFISLNDSGGLRIQEGMDALEAYGWLFKAQTEASGVIPQIALVMGPCLGGQAYHPVMEDFIIQVKGTGFLGIAGPAFVEAQTGEKISLDKLCGVEAHAYKSGQTHIIAENDKDCLDKVKELLKFLPQNNTEQPPINIENDPPDRELPDIIDIIPDEPYKIFDMKKIIKKVVDNGDFFELMPYFAPNLIIGFACMNGRTVGIVANQPSQLGGVLDINASDKGARFIRFCDLFNIPLITFVDCPAYMIGSHMEWNGILRHGAKLLFAWSDATVPLISIIIRKSYAGAHYGMLDKSIGADFVFAWPTAIVTALDGKTVVNILYAKEIKQIKDKENKEKFIVDKIKEYNEIYSNPYHAANRGFIDDIIDPKDTRKIINRALDILANKWKIAYKERPWRKYSNINL